MKAFKQLSYSKEKRMVFSYAGIMSLLSFFILLSPLFAQDDENVRQNEPKVHIDVKKEFDENGNISRFDSTYSWYWSVKGNDLADFDSLFDDFNLQFDLFGDQFNGIVIPQLPPFHYFRYDDENDSSGYFFHDFDDMHKFFNKDFDLKKMIPDKEFIERYQKEHEAFLERYKEYQKEHQKLIEKYFRLNENNDETKPKAEPDNFKSPEKPDSRSKTGKI
jgi:hypothetical protein